MGARALASALRTAVAATSPPAPRAGLHPDDATPIPRPSHYYGRRHYGSMTNLLRQDQTQTKDHAIAAPPLAPATVERAPAKIDKSQLAIAEPKRLPDKAHLKFVASATLPGLWPTTF